MIYKSAAVIAALAMVAASCGSDDDAAEDTTVADTATQDTASQDTATEDTAAEDTGGEDTGGEIAGEGVTLRANWGGFPENWLPGADFASGYFDVAYESLFGYESDEIVGQLVTDWEQTDESLTLTIRDGVLFHDGETLSAESVKASLEASRDSGTRASGPLQVVESIDVIDELTVQLNTSGAAPGLLGSLASISGVMYSPAALESGILAEQPVGTGPWAYNSDASSFGTRLTFDFFPDYWDGRESVGFDTVELYAIEDDNAATGALTTGEIDITDSEVPFLEQFDANDAYDYLLYPAVRNGLHFFDRGPDGLFGDVDVRRAVCQALDTSVVNLLEPDIEPASQYFAEGEVGHIADFAGWPHDLAAAEQLFADAGSPSISAEYLATFFNETQITVYAEQMGALGIQMSVQTVPPPQFFSAWNTGEYPVGTGSQDEGHPYDWYLSWYAADAPNNPSGWEPDELKAAADAAIAAGSSPEADGLWSDAVAVIEDQALSCGRMVGQEILAWSTERLTNVEPTPRPYETQTVNYKALRPAGS
jgi:peptide/nickel transport system substrate-binding protein